MLLAALALASLAPDVSLAGVVVGRSGRHAALLSSEGRTRAVLVGERAFGCEVLAVEPSRVDLRCGDEVRKLALATAPRASASTPVAAQPQGPPADVTVDRAELDTRLQNEMPRLISETTLVPVMSRGLVSGFTLTRIPQGSILESLGLRAGDVLTDVNDAPVDSFTTLVALWPKLQTASSVRARILRDGRPMEVSVAIR